MSLLVISTHPIQYHAPVYRALQQQFHIPTTVIYGSDFSITGYQDRGFGVSVAWDTDLLSGYNSIFLSRVAEGGAANYQTVSANGLLKTLKQIEFRCILLLGYNSSFHLAAFWATRQISVPIILRAEAADRNIKRNRLKQNLRNVVLKLFYKQFTRILYIGEESHSHYLRLGYPQEKLIFSPYCIDTSIFAYPKGNHEISRKDVRKELNIDNSRIVLLFSGKLTVWKAPHFLLNALKSLSDKLLSRVTVIFLGDGELSSQLKTEATKAPQIDARFVGFKNQTELSPYYYASDILVLPSLGETWGLVVNEALYHGLPCVVSDRVGCAPDLVKPGVTGEIFTSGSVISLADAIQRCITLVENPDTVTRCQELVSHYSIEAAARGIAQAYTELTSTK